MSDQETLGQRLREKREYLGYTQDQVANYLDVHRPTVSQIEAGQRKVDSLELKKLAKLYQCSLSHLLGEEATEPISEELAQLMAHLPTEDQDELVKFANFLRWRKEAR